MGVVKLVPNNALCVDQEGMAAALERCAARVRAGEFTDLERVIVIYDVGSSVYPNTYGRQCNRAELIGLLEYAKATTMNPED